MGLILAADDFTAGDYVAVHSVQPIASRAFRAKQDILAHCQFMSPVPPGIPLRVLEVSLPFVACGLLEPGGCESGPVIIDIRVVRLCRIRSVFVDAIKAFPAVAVEECDYRGEVE